MRKKKPWYDEKSFWRVSLPYLFPEIRIAHAIPEIEDIVSLLKLKPPEHILDLCCGVGRHSIELAKRGFEVTGVDRNRQYLKIARERAKKAGMSINFIKADMRNFKKSRAYDLVISLFTSFGYFERESVNRKVARNIFQSLKKKGTLLMELMGKEVLARIFQKRDWIENEDFYMLEDRRVSEDWRYILSDWIFVNKKKKGIKKFTIKLRLYSVVELSGLLKNVGFRKVTPYGDLSGRPYDNIARRLVVVAKK